jgi:hypothetical protein
LSEVENKAARWKRRAALLFFLVGDEVTSRAFSASLNFEQQSNEDAKGKRSIETETQCLAGAKPERFSWSHSLNPIIPANSKCKRQKKRPFMRTVWFVSNCIAVDFSTFPAL